MTRQVLERYPTIRSAVSTATEPYTCGADRHSTRFLRDESCRMRVQALKWQTCGRPDAPVECVSARLVVWCGRG